MNIVLDLSTPRLNGAEIKAIRQGLGWSRDHLSKALGVSHSTVHSWELGIRTISQRNKELMFMLIEGINKLNQNQKKKQRTIDVDFK